MLHDAQEVGRAARHGEPKLALICILLGFCIIWQQTLSKSDVFINASNLALTSMSIPPKSFITSPIPPIGYLSEFAPIVNTENEAPMNLGIVIKGELSIHKIPQYFVLLNNLTTKYKAVIDTGSYHSHISQNALRDIGFPPATGYTISEHPVYGVVRDPVFEVSYRFDGHDHQFKDQFSLMTYPFFQYDVIIGAHFLSKCKMLSCFGVENRFELHI